MSFLSLVYGAAGHFCKWRLINVCDDDDDDDEWLMRVIQSMYEGAVNSVKLGVSESAEFAVKVGVHQ